MYREILTNKKMLIIIITAIIAVAAAIAFIQLIETKNETPEVWLSANITFGKAPLDISFTGIALDSDGKIVSYYWDFGDGTNSAEKNPSHVYTEPAEYTVTFIATDDSGDIGQDNITLKILGDQIPIAKINANQESGKPPLKVIFSGTGIDMDGKIVSYYWDFGDGTTSTKRNISHIYNETGTYQVKLTVTDNDGYSDSDIYIVQIIDNYRPNATIIYDCKDNMRAPLKVDFSCNATDIDGTIVSYEWEIERSFPYPFPLNIVVGRISPVVTSDEKNFTNTFWSTGRYYAKLTVTDDNGATYTTMELIQVKKHLIKQSLDTIKTINSTINKLYNIYQIIKPYIPEDLLPDWLNEELFSSQSVYQFF